MQNLPVDFCEVVRAIEAGKRMGVSGARDAVELGRARGRLSLDQVAALAVHGSRLEDELFDAAARLRLEFYGRRMVLFAPLYWSDRCDNRCQYCGYRTDAGGRRRVLTPEEVVEEARVLSSRGYRRVLLESGESARHAPVERLTEIMSALYGLRDDLGRPCIDRVNVNVAATTVKEYRAIRDAGVGTYNLFQETYHLPTYVTVHAGGPKSNFVRQITAMDRAFEAGIDDVGLGVLWGLYDPVFELVSLVAHARHLEKTHGVGPHTFSVPRVKPASGSDFVPTHPLSDDGLLRVVAILRLTVPSAGVVISTREPSELRRRAFRVGVSQTSAGSSTEVGGYGSPDHVRTGQFSLEDTRGLDDVVRELLEDGFVPSFCTACEQRGRMGRKFAKVAVTGDIGKFCGPNALMALRQYVSDGLRLGFTTAATAEAAERVIESELSRLPTGQRVLLRERLKEIADGRQARELYI